MDDLDDAFAAAPSDKPDGHARRPITAAEYAALPAPAVPSGFFTLTLTDGATRRFRVRLERGNYYPGRRTLARNCKLSPDEEIQREWESIGLVTPGGFALFHRWKREREATWAAALWALLHGQPAPGYSVAVERRCGMTMRELKGAEAIETGLCAKWAKEFGLIAKGRKRK